MALTDVQPLFEFCRFQSTVPIVLLLLGGVEDI